jgi:hypothetical protein
MKVATKNAVELPVSFVFWLVAMWSSLPRPLGFANVLVIGGCQVIAFVCALNAALDFQRFRMFGRVALLAWFAFMAILTPLVLWNVGSIKVFGLK